MHFKLHWYQLLLSAFPSSCSLSSCLGPGLSLLSCLSTVNLPHYSFKILKNEGENRRKRGRRGETIFPWSFYFKPWLTDLWHGDKGVNRLINPIRIHWPYLNVNKQIQISCKCRMHSKHVGLNLTILSFFLFFVPLLHLFILRDVCVFVIFSFLFCHSWDYCSSHFCGILCS